MNHAESVMLAHLTDPDSLDVLAREGFLVPTVQEVIPTELVRKLVQYALDEYFASGRKVAPSKEALTEAWSTEIEQSEIVIDDDTETDSIGWAIDSMRAQFAQLKSQGFVTKFAKDINLADPTQKVATVQQAAYDLFSLSQQLSSKQNEMDLALGVEDALARYLHRQEHGHKTMGMTFGMPEIDDHIFGVHPGEIAVVAAGSGVGKSWFAGKTTLAEWKAGRQAILFSLENDLPMTFDRLACMGARVPYENWQRGECHEGDIERVNLMLAKLNESSNKPMIIMPDRGERTTVAMVRKAHVLGGQSIIIDQLSHITPPREVRKQDRRQQISAIMYELQEVIREGVNPMSCMLLHQINREGKKESKSSGKYVMEHLAESADVERAVDFIFTIYQSADDEQLQEAVFGMLKGRRVKKKSWRVSWRLDVGDIRVREEIIDAA